MKEITFGIMKKLLTNKLAQTLNLEGRNRDHAEKKDNQEKKLGFKSLSAYLLVHGETKLCLNSGLNFFLYVDFHI